MAYVISAYVYFARGLFDLQSAGDIALWKVTNIMYPLMVVPLFIFLGYPYLIEKEGTMIALIMKLAMLYSFIISVFNFIIIGIADVQWTYDDPYGLSHYALTLIQIPYVYYITLILVVSIAFFSVILLALAFRRETDPFFKTRTLLLLIGWLSVFLGQLLLLSPTLAIVQPMVAIPGVILIAIGVIRPRS